MEPLVALRTAAEALRQRQFPAALAAAQQGLATAPDDPALLGLTALALPVTNGAKGITSIHNMDGNRHLLDLLRSVDAEGALSARVSVPFHLTREMDLSELSRARAMAADFTGDRITSNRVKIFIDGVIESGTAAMLDDYSDRPAHRGEPIFDAAAFAKAATAIDAMGMQIAVHAIGDAAVRIALDGYQTAQATNGRRDSRHRIEHIEMIDPADIPRLAALGVIASVQPLHAPRGESATTRSIGPNRAAHAYAWAALHKAGARIAFSSDWPIVPVDPPQRCQPHRRVASQFTQGATPVPASVPRLIRSRRRKGCFDAPGQRCFRGRGLE